MEATDKDLFEAYQPVQHSASSMWQCQLNVHTFSFIYCILPVTIFVAHISGEVEAESEDDDDDDDDCKKGSMDEVCISQVTFCNQFKY